MADQSDELRNIENKSFIIFTIEEHAPVLGLIVTSAPSRWQAGVQEYHSVC